MEIWAPFLIIIAITALLIGIYISIYNKLQFAKSKIEHVESLIDEDLRIKYDLIVRINDIIKSNLKNKKDYLKEYINLKEQNISNFDFDRKLKEAENVIYNLYNDSVSLNKNDLIIEVLEDLKNINVKLTAGISYYNKQTSLLNMFIRKFPNNIIATLHGIKIKTFFDQKDMNDNILDDFKI